MDENSDLLARIRALSSNIASLENSDDSDRSEQEAPEPTDEEEKEGENVTETIVEGENSKEVQELKDAVERFFDICDADEDGFIFDSDADLFKDRIKRHEGVSFRSLLTWLKFMPQKTIRDLSRSMFIADVSKAFQQYTDTPNALDILGKLIKLVEDSIELEREELDDMSEEVMKEQVKIKTPNLPQRSNPEPNMLKEDPKDVQENMEQVKDHTPSSSPEQAKDLHMIVPEDEEKESIQEMKETPKSILPEPSRTLDAIKQEELKQSLEVVKANLSQKTPSPSPDSPREPQAEYPADDVMHSSEEIEEFSEEIMEQTPSPSPGRPQNLDPLVFEDRAMESKQRRKQETIHLKSDPTKSTPKGDPTSPERAQKKRKRVKNIVAAPMDETPGEGEVRTTKYKPYKLQKSKTISTVGHARRSTYDFQAMKEIFAPRGLRSTDPQINRSTSTNMFRERKLGPREIGVTKGYRRAKYEVRADDHNYEKDALYYQPSKSSLYNDRKLGPREIGTAKYKVAKYELPKHEGPIFAPRIPKVKRVFTIERKLGPRDYKKPRGWDPPPKEWEAALHTESHFTNKVNFTTPSRPERRRVKTRSKTIGMTVGLFDDGDVTSTPEEFKPQQKKKNQVAFADSDPPKEKMQGRNEPIVIKRRRKPLEDVFTPPVAEESAEELDQAFARKCIGDISFTPEEMEDTEPCYSDQEDGNGEEVSEEPLETPLEEPQEAAEESYTYSHEPDITEVSYTASGASPSQTDDRYFEGSDEDFIEEDDEEVYEIEEEEIIMDDNIPDDKKAVDMGDLEDLSKRIMSLGQDLDDSL